VKENKEDITLSAVDKRSKAFFARGEFNWAKSEADVWSALEAKIDALPAGRSLKFNFNFSKLAVAASILVFFSVLGFLRYYSIRIETTVGQHLVAELPDHSKAELNAQSKITYYPYWWRVSRIVKLDGEAFFEVEKGKKFTVISTKGTTQVLGTTFNIFSRDNVYKVTCVSGSVKVKSGTGSETILKPNSKAEIDARGKITVLTNIETYPEISWKKNIFLFTASPLFQVFSEIERQYGVKIEVPTDNLTRYTGNFSKDQKVEDILNYVCSALGLKYIQKSSVEYIIIRENE
jgi:ferric-dicitrate binding protein FerR (iron transport regulator)